MSEQKRILIVIVSAAVAMMVTILWRAVYSIKHKGDEKALDAMTKAQAGSSWTLWFWFICWEGFAPYIFGKDAIVLNLSSKTSIISIALFKSSSER